MGKKFSRSSKYSRNFGGVMRAGSRRRRNYRNAGLNNRMAARRAAQSRSRSSYYR